MNKEDIRKDILAFSDDDSDVIMEPTGEIVFYKNGESHLCSFRQNHEGVWRVKYNDEEDISYNEFISKKLARLDVFALKLKEKRKKVDFFIDGPAHLYTRSKEVDASAMELLKQECDNFFEFGSKINFITADAGQGKSVLLKQFQYDQAERYLKKESRYLFWHIDLQGRDLVRLGEALMYDLGDLRMSGLYYPSIINLVRKKMIILAIDGFDELAAEIGGINVQSSLSNFITEMNGNGTLICASRRTFFDTEDYLKKTNIINNKDFPDLVFNELKLRDWTKKQVIEYFTAHGYAEADKIYSNILLELQNDEHHPILTRPFLLAKLEQSLDGNPQKIPIFFSNRHDKKEGIILIVEAFTKREVEKWKDRNAINQETGKPYLTFDQHIELLATIANDMWENKKDFVTKDEIELYAVLLTEKWKIPEDTREKIVRTAAAHAFLTAEDNTMKIRKFDHDEFKNYFLARALANLINDCILKNETEALHHFLYLDQLPDSVAIYCFNYINNKATVAEQVLHIFTDIIKMEWKPSYIQTNIGTLVPFLLNNLNNSSILTVESVESKKIEYSSLIFESKNIKNVTFHGGIFTNISFRNTSFDNIIFKNCEFNKIKYYDNTNKFNNVSFVNCSINSLIIPHNAKNTEMIFAPKIIASFFQRQGVSVKDTLTTEEDFSQKEPSIFKKTLLKFIFKYNQQTIQYDKDIIEEKYLGDDTDLIVNEIIPLLEKYRIIQTIDTKKSRQMKAKAFRLLVNTDVLLKSDREDIGGNYEAFWREVNNHI